MNRLPHLSFSILKGVLASRHRARRTLSQPLVRWSLAAGFAGALVTGPLACERAADAGPATEAGARAGEAPSPAAHGAAQPAAATGAQAAPQGQASYREAGFELSLEVPGTAEVGQATEAKVVLKTKEPYKVNDEYPIKLTLVESSGLAYPSPTLGKEAVALEAKQAVMKVPFTPQASGKHTLAGRLSFSVCTDERCLIEKRQLAAPVAVR